MVGCLRWVSVSAVLGWVRFFSVVFGGVSCGVLRFTVLGGWVDVGFACLAWFLEGLV